MLRRHLVTLTAICVLPLALAACGEATEPDPRVESPLVRAATARLASFASRSFTGIVAARVQSDLGFRVSGKVSERLVDTGQSVKQGQVLMRIDPIDLTLAAHAQQEAVSAARAWAKQTEEEERRYRNLRGTGAISVSSYDQAKAAADSAKAQLKAAEAQADVAQNATRYAQLTADADGIVMETLAEPGQVVSTGQVVVRIARAGSREAVIQLPETLRPSVGSTGYATLYGKNDAAVSAQLRQISQVADKLTRTFEARYVLEGEQANAPLGSTVTITIPAEAGPQRGGLQVPIGSLFDAGKGPGVWVINGKPAKVSWHPVTVQHLDQDSVRVSGSIKPGDQVVALGTHLLHEGEQVRVANQTSVSSTEEVRP